MNQNLRRKRLGEITVKNRFKLRGLTDLFDISKFLYSQYRNKEENTQEIEDRFFLLANFRYKRVR